MKPVTDALNNWIKTLITNRKHSYFRFIPMNNEKYTLGTNYVMEHGQVPHFQKKTDDTLLRICFNTLSSKTICTKVMITKPSVLRTGKANDDDWFRIECDRLKCKDIVEFIEYFKTNFKKIINNYYRPNPLIAYNPDDHAEKFKLLNAYDYTQTMNFFEGCKSFLEKRNENNKRVKEVNKDFKKG